MKLEMPGKKLYTPAMPVFTKTGDQGETSLANQKRVTKNDPHMHALGDLDEFSCWLGWTLCHSLSPNLRATLTQAQMNIQKMSSFVAQAASHPRLLLELQEHTQELEDDMDNLEGTLPPLRDFILPGGTPIASALHICRAICRRAERSVVALLDRKEVDAGLVMYLNRLSDYLFMAARKVNSV
jgi:cob(I)alamin adenosyltransferase